MIGSRMTARSGDDTRSSRLRVSEWRMFLERREPLASV